MVKAPLLTFSAHKGTRMQNNYCSMCSSAKSLGLFWREWNPSRECENPLHRAGNSCLLVKTTNTPQDRIMLHLRLCIMLDASKVTICGFLIVHLGPCCCFFLFTCIICCFSGPVMSCDWLSDGQKLVSASWDHTAKLWDFKTAQVIISLEGNYIIMYIVYIILHPQ